MSDEESFKKGAVGIRAVLIGLAVVALAVGLFFLARKTTAETMSIEQVVAEQQRIFKLPKDEATKEWRRWAGSSEQFELQQQALLQLGWLKDLEAIPLATKALEQKDHRIRGVAAQVLASFGTPAADAARPKLLAVFKEADSSDQPQIAWALVELRATEALTDVLKVYRAGHLAKVQRIGGGTAFNPEKLAKMAPLETWATMVGDESVAVRQLIAVVLSENAEPKHTDALIALVKDSEIEVAREAASGLGRIGDERARRPLLDALAKADKESRKKFLEALRNGIGGEGLVLALDSVDKSQPETYWHQNKVIFTMLKDLADPRAADLLVKFIEKGQPRHWEVEAAMRLAEVGDPRAVPFLAERLRLNTVKLYGDAELPEEKALARGDDERIVGARMLADLAVLHPDLRDKFREQAEDATMSWITEMPQPHANGLRFLATVRSTKVLPRLRDWAFPSVPLPREGQQGAFPREWEVAQSALRYVGRMKDQQSFPKFETMLAKRRSDAEDINVTMDSLMGGGLAMVGMAIRGIGVGVSDAYAEWGDTKAYPVLRDYIENPKENEQSRVQACFALGWVTPSDKASEIAEKIKKYAASQKPEDQFIAACFTESLARRPIPEANKDIIGLLSPSMEPILRLNIAQAIGFAGLKAEDEPPLFDKLQDPEVRGDAAIALLLGGSADTATRTVAAFSDFPPEAMAQLRDNYYRVFGYWSDRDLDEGRLFRFVRNAETVRRIRVRDAPQEWASFLLARQFDNLSFDNGPHSMTRVVLRNRLRQAALKGDAATRQGALEVLRFMREQGMLMALKTQGGDVGQEAGEALFLLMNPKAVIDVTTPDGKTGGSKILPSQQ